MFTIDYRMDLFSDGGNLIGNSAIYYGAFTTDEFWHRHHMTSRIGTISRFFECSIL